MRGQPRGLNRGISHVVGSRASMIQPCSTRRRPLQPKKTPTLRGSEPEDSAHLMASAVSSNDHIAHEAKVTSFSQRSHDASFPTYEYGAQVVSETRHG
jgi:hypothetical protein